MNQQQVAVAHSTTDRKPGKTALGYSFKLITKAANQMAAQSTH